MIETFNEQTVQDIVDSDDWWKHTCKDGIVMFVPKNHSCLLCAATEDKHEQD